MSDQQLDFLRHYGISTATFEAPSIAPVSTFPGSVPAVPDDATPADGKVPKKRRPPKKRDKPPKQALERAAAREQRVQNRQVVQEKCKNCYYACPSKISDERRKVINEQYWGMRYSEQKAFVRAHTEQGKVKRRRVKTDPLGDEPPDLKRAFTYKFSLMGESGKLETVCCAFFLGTLGYKNKSSTLIYRAYLPDKPPRVQGPREKPAADAVWEDVLSYAPRTYHKGAKYGGTALYLPTSLTIRMMYRDFEIKMAAKGEKACCYGTYHRVLTDMDVHFVEMEDFPIPERPQAPVEVFQRDQKAEELYEPPPMIQEPPPIYCPVEYKPCMPVYPEPSYEAVPQNYHIDSIKQEPQPIATDFSTSHDHVNYPEEYLDQYSEHSYEEETDDREAILEEPKVEIIHEEFLGPESKPSQVVQLPGDQSEPSKVPSKQKNSKKASELTPQTLPEGYPPIKYPKRFIQRTCNRAKRRQLHQVMQTDCKCIFNCNEKLTLEQRERINQEYWAAGFSDQRMFILAHTERHSIKRRRSKSEEKRRDFTYSYRLLDSQGQYQQVCSISFLNTLGYDAKSNAVIYRAHQVELGEAITDRRGKSRVVTDREVFLRDAVDNHLLSYFTPDHVESGARLDLSATDLNPKKMYNEYLAATRQTTELGCEKPASFSYYYKRTLHLKIVFAPKPEPKKGGAKAKKRRPPVEFDC